MSGAADPFLLYGTHETEAEPLHLVAGSLAADLDNGNLRTITYDGVEVLRAIAYIVRDRDWGTYSPAIHDLAVEKGDDGFTVSYQASCKGPDGSELRIDVRIRADESGSLVYEAIARSGTGFETNRCGFCILHPIVGLAGAPVTVEHADGARVDTHLPDLIEPWQPFKDMRAISHEVMPGVSAECRMEGDVFEMEDQRNWSDPSYKTYVRPLALPWPYRIEAGEEIAQRVVLTISDRRVAQPPRTAKRDEVVTIRRGEAHGVMPNIGLIVTPEEAKASLAAADLLQIIAPQHLLFHFDPLAGHDGSAFEDFAALAARHDGRISLEIALPCERSLDVEAREIAAQMQAAGFAPDAVIVSPAIDRQSTPPGSAWPPCPPLENVYAAARAAFPGIRLGGGMLSYFTELNRKRVPGDLIDFVTHCTNPIVHAADDIHIMQTLEALPFITRSVRAIYGDKPYRIGPSTIPMRQNPYGSRTMENPHGKRIAMANRDPRHNGRFAEAFAFAYAARVLDAGLDSLTLSAFTGPFGLIAGDGEPMPKGGPRPIFHAVKTLAHLAGTKWRECVSSNPDRVLAFETRPAFGEECRLHLVNITGCEQPVDLGTFAVRDGEAGRVLPLAPYATVSLALQD
jgi:D-apionolactonase